MMKELSDLLLGWTNYCQTKVPAQWAKHSSFNVKGSENPRKLRCKRLKNKYIITLGGWVYPRLPPNKNYLTNRKSSIWELFNLLLAVWRVPNPRDYKAQLLPSPKLHLSKITDSCAFIEGKFKISSNKILSRVSVSRSDDSEVV